MLLSPPWALTERCSLWWSSEGSAEQEALALQTLWTMEALVHMGAAGPLEIMDTRDELTILTLGAGWELTAAHCITGVTPAPTGIHRTSEVRL